MLLGFRTSLLILPLISAAFALKSNATERRHPANHSLLILDASQLKRTLDRISSKEPGTLKALAALKDQADAALKAGPFSVVHKSFEPPSGDKHDYMSIGPYWWRNPNTENGLPYVRRDGQVNPERDKFDSKSLHLMCTSVDTLARAWYFSGEEKYATHTAKLLRIWFLNEKTRMNPNLNFSQAIPGRTTGRGVGTIDTRRFISLIDSITLLRDSNSWSDKDHEAIRNWFATFGKWLRESPNGRSAFRAKNNIGTWYEAQTVAVLVFAGQNDVAKTMLTKSGTSRYAHQIDPQGRLPHELARTRSFDYTSMNLVALLNLAVLGDKLGLDLWSFKTDDGRSLRVALDWFAPFAAKEKEWPYKQIHTIQRQTAEQVYRRAAIQFQSEKYRNVVRQIVKSNESNSTNQLLWPID